MPPDYTDQNLRGRSFKDQNLTGANFSKADIRGANFTNAILKGANFTGAKAGLQRRWAIGLLIVSWLLAALSGFVSILIGALVAYILDTKNTENFVIGIVSLVIVAVFCIVTSRNGLTAGLGAVAFAFAVAVAFAVALASLLFSAYIGWRTLAGDEKDAWLRSVALAFAATGGTSFHGADLTDADLTGATLKNTDFRKVNLTRARFYEAKKLDFALNRLI